MPRGTVLEPLQCQMLPMHLLDPGEVWGQQNSRGNRGLWPVAFGQLAWKYFNSIKWHVETTAAQLRVSLGDS